MNSRQRRILRRYHQRLEAADLADTYGDPDAPPTVVHVARHVERLHIRTLRRRYRQSTRRDPRAYGLRCSVDGCHRKAHTSCGPYFPALCREHNDDVPF